MQDEDAKRIETAEVAEERRDENQPPVFECFRRARLKLSFQRSTSPQATSATSHSSKTIHSSP